MTLSFYCERFIRNDTTLLGCYPPPPLRAPPPKGELLAGGTPAFPRRFPSPAGERTLATAVLIYLLFVASWFVSSFLLLFLYVMLCHFGTAGTLVARDPEHRPTEIGVVLDAEGAVVRTVDRAIVRIVVVVAEHPRRGRDG